MSKLRRHKNIGPETEKWLNAIGIYTIKELEEYGVVRAYAMLKESGFPVTRNFLYAAKAAILDIDWRTLSQPIKDQLNKEADQY